MTSSKLFRGYMYVAVACLFLLMGILSKKSLSTFLLYILFSTIFFVQGYISLRKNKDDVKEQQKPVWYILGLYGVGMLIGLFFVYGFIHEIVVLDVPWTWWRLLLAGVLGLFALAIGLFFIFASWTGMTKAFFRVVVVNDVLFVGKKNISIKDVDSVWHYDYSYWICASKDETTMMHDAVHMVGEGRPVLHFNEKKCDFKKWLVGWKRQEYEDVQWWTKKN